MQQADEHREVDHVVEMTEAEIAEEVVAITEVVVVIVEVVAEKVVVETRAVAEEEINLESVK
jgi:hypothetical protein